MATAKELYQAGELQLAVEELNREVKANPNDSQRRIFLFELLCFAGEYDRAEKQLDVIALQSATAELGVQVYRNNIKAERDRRKLLSQGLWPHFLTDPPAYVGLHLMALDRLREGDTVEARALLDRAAEERPARAGRLREQLFSDFRDSDDFLGPVLELIVQDRYVWCPIDQVRQVKISAPKQLRDLVWAPAHIETAYDTFGEVFMPALYVGSNEYPDDQVKLGRMTAWKTVGDGLYLAAGLRLFLVDGEDLPVFEIGGVEFDGRAETLYPEHPSKAD